MFSVWRFTQPREIISLENVIEKNTLALCDETAAESWIFSHSYQSTRSLNYCAVTATDVATK